MFLLILLAALRMFPGIVSVTRSFERSPSPGRKFSSAKEIALRWRLRYMAVLAGQCLRLGRWRSTQKAFHT